jgi:hypothetical protein
MNVFVGKLSKFKLRGRDSKMVIIVARLIISCSYVLLLDRIRIYKSKNINMFHYKSHSYQNRANTARCLIKSESKNRYFRQKCALFLNNQDDKSLFVL